MIQLVRFWGVSTRKLNLHEDLLSLQEINTAIGSVVQTPDRAFLQSVRDGEVDMSLWSGVNMKTISNETAVEVVRSLQGHERVQQKLMRLFRWRMGELTLGQIATIVQTYAQSRRFDQSFFREVENEVYERVQDGQLLSVPDAEKILRAYQHSQFGSAVLYGCLTRVFKVAQFELDPLKLAEYCKVLAKSTERGGFGLYTITEQRVQERIRDYDFHDLVRLATSFYSVNIGSTRFQVMLEEKLSSHFPSNKELAPSDLVRLMRATSKYIFRYNSLALFNQMESAALALLPHISHRQFAHVMWSLMRSGRGSYDIYVAAEEEVKRRFQFKFIYFKNKRVKALSMRQLTLLYLVSTEVGDAKYLNQDLLDEVKLRIKEVKVVGPTLQTQLVHVLMGILRAQKEPQLQQHIIDLMIAGQVRLTQSMKANVVQACMHSPISAHSLLLLLHIVKEQDDLVFQFTRRILGSHFPMESPTPPTQEVSKAQFHMALHLNPHDPHLLDVLTYLADREEEMRFIFSQDQWVLISWNMLLNVVLNNTVDSRVMEQISLGIREINPNILSSINLTKYVQSLIMVSQLEKRSLTYMSKKLSKLITMKQDQLLQGTVLLYPTDETLLNSLTQVLLSVVSAQVEGTPTAYVNLFEQQFMQFIPTAVLLGDQLKFALLPLSIQQDFIQRDFPLQEFRWEEFYSGKYPIRREMEAQLYTLQNLGWNAQFIVKEVWDTMEPQQQYDHVKKLFTVTYQKEEEDTQESEQLTKTKQKKRTFKSKLQKYAKEDSFKYTTISDDEDDN